MVDHNDPRIANVPSGPGNPRYEVYARVHGRTYDEMLAHDETLYPGGKMAGFIIWISEQWRAWRILRGVPEHQFLMLRDHVDFDAWLQEQLK